MGGWIAYIGSWRIGFNPSPSWGIGNKWLNGLEVIKRNKKKPIIIISWNNKVIIWYFFDSFLEVIKKIKIKKTIINKHNNKLPSWFPHVPEIL